MAGADALMNSTLPAIVGMGVVSRSTDTMFGRRSSGGGKRKGVVKSRAMSRKAKVQSRMAKMAYSKEPLQRVVLLMKKSTASTVAKRARKAGAHARVVKVVRYKVVRSK